MNKSKELGQVFTPKVISDYMINECIKNWRLSFPNISIKEIKIFEPSVGKGVFIESIIEALKSEYIKEGIEFNYEYIFNNVIYAMDIDSDMISYCIEKFKLKDIKHNFICDNTLLCDVLGLYNIKDGFDIVIGNPPYGLFNKKQNKGESIIVSEDELNYYKNIEYYAPATGGMLNIFRLFILKSIRLLAPNGIFSEIFPLSFIGDLSIAKLRKYILNNYQILSIDAFPERDDENKRVFKAVKMSVCIMNLKKKKSNKDFFIRINSDKFVDVTAPLNFVNKELIEVLDKKSMTFPLTSIKETIILKKIFLIGKRFSEIGKCNTGEIDMTFCKNAFSMDQNDSILLKGAIIDRYLLRKKMSQGEIIYIDEKKLSNIKKIDKSIYQNSRVVLQGITGVNEKTRLKMMIISDAYCANSLNYLYLYKSINLKYLLALFNSKLLNFVFSKFSTNSNVNGYEVDNLPIVLSDKKSCSNIESLVDQVLQITSAPDYDPKNPPTEQKELEKQIDQMVYELYGLTEEEIRIVEEITKKG